MKISARLADRTDEVEINAIGAAIAQELQGQRGAAVHLAELSLTPEASVTFVGCIDDAVVGFARLRVQIFDAENTVGDVISYGVLADARGVGVGESMLDLVIEYCRDHGCTGIDAQALPGARETKNFFETFGFTARRLVVHHSLRAPD